ncbi:hypothetical protein A2313_04355 [Candidatus Roizmanbacteria bacterium RIFOXYB2_FULL_41_10]|uniref:Uncharacterized protein n=1 Tax=Candidatus Roizmanbacteria bacterium RIFOXYA1_FULL_41_12 TaxID=1802082 RepID=A0A1F7KF87_9BACT|nr:MAG: hypothetical protein A2262_00340 [Candidatus Roizmanbacteria bacterium RIFOXYA2_FULL_41_8]OGK66516.1 MAG: hypothetical protein A2209_00745 [Candidatus Roizmanbacteria bacterium RIFOXYA1_FULL_41_12]OGK67067.1 MAG: hypothetical protein A2377_03675 [Candidatus Roizmanbacteria bacterium RIFOXYB1_FULL_41_27]OGK69390.1 MAG: hypothetical protein A2403_04185 [Candidatus Roizmanbacteria bacterium RIFOXYC1_FULL_41_16]OGK72163.1 MAG: hypothetical protein A2313_04355 [Candidatus Roizmanbacteria bac
MKRLFEDLFKTTLTNLFRFSVSNSFNKTEFHFHGSINISEKLPAPKLTKEKEKNQIFLNEMKRKVKVDL